jgi:predicted phage terminase large subunit-like protein
MMSLVASPTRTASALRRRHFIFFLMKVFATLHPGEPPLTRAWYLLAICFALGEVCAGRLLRLVITVPPRHLKSITVAVAFVAWQLGQDPTQKIMVASYSQDLARLHADLTRTVMQTDWYKRDFSGTRISPRGDRALELVTTKGGFRKAVSVGGTITGYGADIIVIDDCMKADDARSQTMRDELRNWYDHTLVSRLDDKRSGRIISIQQRLHEDDLPAYLLDKGFAHLNLPAIAETQERVQIGTGEYHLRIVGDMLNPEREDQAVLAQLRRDLGPVVFSAQYQQDPVAPEGNLLRMEWFGTYETAPPRAQFHKVIQSWDTGMSDAPTSDFSVCMTWGYERDSGKWYLLDVMRARLAFPDLERAVVRLQREYQADTVLIEYAGSGIGLIQDLKVKASFTPTAVRPKGSKEDRFNGCLAEIEAGRFLLPAAASWLVPLRSELRAFPNSRNDDQADSLSQFVYYQRAKWRSVEMEYTETGRPLRSLRGRARRRS